MAQPPKTKTCPECNHSSGISDRFCAVCGWKYRPLLISEGGDYTEDEIADCRNRQKAEEEEFDASAPIVDHETLTDEEIILRLTREKKFKITEVRRTELMKKYPELMDWRPPFRPGLRSQEEKDQLLAELEEHVKKLSKEKNGETFD